MLINALFAAIDVDWWLYGQEEPGQWGRSFSTEKRGQDSYLDQPERKEIQRRDLVGSK